MGSVDGEFQGREKGELFIHSNFHSVTLIPSSCIQEQMGRSLLLNLANSITDVKLHLFFLSLLKHEQTSMCNFHKIFRPVCKVTSFAIQLVQGKWLQGLLELIHSPLTLYILHSSIHHTWVKCIFLFSRFFRKSLRLGINTKHVYFSFSSASPNVKKDDKGDILYT